MPSAPAACTGVDAHPPAVPAPAGLPAAVPMGLGGRSQDPRPRHRVELLGRLPLLGWWAQGAPSTQGDAGEGPAGFGDLGGVGEAGPTGSSSVQPNSPGTFASPSPSRKFLFIQHISFGPLLFIKVYSSLTLWGGLTTAISVWMKAVFLSVILATFDK